MNRIIKDKKRETMTINQILNSKFVNNFLMFMQYGYVNSKFT